MNKQPLPPGLNGNQTAFLSAYLTCQSIEDACKAAKVARATYYKWVHENAPFMEALRTIRGRLLAEAMNEFMLLHRKARARLAKAIDSPNEGIATRAAMFMLEHTKKAEETAEIEERLARLEAELEKGGRHAN